MHFNGRFVVNLAELAAQQGVDRDQLLSVTGKSYVELCSDECRLDAATYDNFLAETVKQCGDPFFGLHAGEQMNLQAAGLIVQIAHTAGTVKEALQYCCEFANLGCSALPTALMESENGYKLTLTPNPAWLLQSPLSVRHTIYGYLAFTLREFESLTRNQCLPIAIHLAFDVEDGSELERVCGCPVHFSQAENAIFLRRKDVDQEVVTSDVALLNVLVAHATEKSKKLMNGTAFYDRVKKSVVQMIKPEFPGIEQVAAHLNLSVRTFQRKLSEEGHSYSELVDELKKEFALGYLKDQELTINEIAYLLSYADGSAFIRTFKKWTGMTPGDYRLEMSK